MLKHGCFAGHNQRCGKHRTTDAGGESILFMAPTFCIAAVIMGDRKQGQIVTLSRVMLSQAIGAEEGDHTTINLNMALSWFEHLVAKAKSFGLKSQWMCSVAVIMGEGICGSNIAPTDCSCGRYRNIRMLSTVLARTRLGCGLVEECLRLLD